MTHLEGIVALCAGAGFVIVWLVFPGKGAEGSIPMEDPSALRPGGDEHDDAQTPDA